MKNVKIFIVSIVFVLVSAGCVQRAAQKPASQGRINTLPPPITERTIEETPPPRYEGYDRPDKKPATRASERTPIDRPPPVIEPRSLLSVGYVNDRIFEYGRKLERWKERDDQLTVLPPDEKQAGDMVGCFKKLQKVLSGYQKLHDDLLQRNVLADSALYDINGVMELQKLDIAFLEGVCGRLLADEEDRSAGWQDRREDADLNQIETLLERYYTNKEYDEVVQVWLRIPAHQVERLDLKSKIYYAGALKFLDQPEKAAELYKQIVDEMSASSEQPTDLISLRRVLADLYAASGNYLAAKDQYNLISSDYQNIGKIEQWSKLQASILDRSKEGSPELTEYSQLLKAYLGYYPERDGYKVVWQADKFLEQYPYSPVSSNVDLIKDDVQKRADAWFNGFFDQVDAYVREKKFQDAMELLKSIPEDLVGPERQQKMKEKSDALVLAEEVARETVKLERMQELQHRWNEGLLLAEKDDFDGAIAIFTELLDTEYGAKTVEKIKELSLLAAKHERRKAAEIFIRFTKTTDIASKKKLLIESRKVLKDILVKYPDVEIADKVVGNVQRVEAEMNVLDPTLLPTLEREERWRAMNEPMSSQPEAVGVDVFDLPLPTPENGASGGGQQDPHTTTQPDTSVMQPRPSRGVKPLPVITPAESL